MSAGGAQQGQSPQYANSGLARFGSIQQYQPTPYQPMLFQAPQLAQRRTMPAYGGLLGSGGGYVDAGGGGSSGIGSVGSVGANGQNADGSPNGQPTEGTPGQLGQIGLALGLSGIPGAMGQAVSIGQSAQAQADAAPADDGTTQGISDAIGQMGVADDGTTEGISNAIGQMGMADDGSDGTGGGGGGGK